MILSCTPTRSSKFAPKSCIKLNCNGLRWSKCGASQLKRNLSKMLTVKMNYVVMSAAWKTKVSPCKTVRRKNEPFNHIKFDLALKIIFFSNTQVLLKAMKLSLSMVPSCRIWIWCIWRVFCKKNKLYAWWWGNREIWILIEIGRDFKYVFFALSQIQFRSSRVEPPDLAGILRSTDDIIESMVCPPPPSDPPMISEEMITTLIVPAPGWSEYKWLMWQILGVNLGMITLIIIIQVTRWNVFLQQILISTLSPT